MEYTKEHKKEQIEQLRNEFRENGYQLKVFRLDQHKMIACYAAFEKYSQMWEVWQINPCFLKSLGFNIGYRKQAAEQGYFWKKWGGPDELTMELSYALFAFTDDARECEHAKYREREITEGRTNRPEGEINGVQHYKNGTRYDQYASYVLKRR